MSLRQRESPLEWPNHDWFSCIHDQSSMRRHTNIRKHVFCTRFQDQKPISPEWPHPSDGSLSTQSTKPISPEWPYPSDGSLSSSPFQLNSHTPQTEVSTNIETGAYVVHNQLLQHRNGGLRSLTQSIREHPWLPYLPLQGHAFRKHDNIRGGVAPNVKIHCLGMYTAWWEKSPVTCK